MDLMKELSLLCPRMVRGHIKVSSQLYCVDLTKLKWEVQVVAETDEPFVPVPDELIVNLRESREAVEALLDNLASSFASTTSVSPSAT